MKTHKTARELEAELGFLEAGAKSSVCDRCADITRSSIQDMRDLSDDLAHVRARQFHAAMETLRISLSILEDEDDDNPREKLRGLRKFITKSMEGME